MGGFRDRVDAGEQLAPFVEKLALHDPVVVGLPRGGVPVAAEVARALPAPLDVLVVRKLGVPGRAELGFGAIGEDGVVVVDTRLVREIGLSDEAVRAVVAAERTELDRRVAAYRHGRPMVSFQGHDVVVVDDGVATGGTARAAAGVCRAHGATRVVLAVPVGVPQTLDALREVYDDVVTVIAPPLMYAVGEWYDDFSQTTDDEVVAMLAGR